MVHGPVSMDLPPKCGDGSLQPPMRGVRSAKPVELGASLVIIIFVSLTVQFERYTPFFIGILACILEFISIIFVCLELLIGRFLSA